MKVIIAGCGKVGYTLAEQLSEENHDISVIDVRADKLEAVSTNLDVIGVVGNGTSYHTLQEAGVEDADLMIAVTDKDEINLLACLIAKKAGNCQTVARVRNPEYHTEIGFLKEELGLSMVINPELAAAAEIARLIQVPSAMEIDTFAKGKVNLIKFEIPKESIWDGTKISEISSRFGGDLLICIVERKDKVMIPDGSTVLCGGDKVSAIVSQERMNSLFIKLGFANKIIKNVMIAGGSRIAYYLSERLIRSRIRVKIMEQKHSRCEELSDLLPGAMIIEGDAASETLLNEEGITDMDAFISLTNFDEENIMLSLYANKVSKAKLITKINKITFEDVINEIPVGSIISPKNLTAEYIIRYVRSMQNSMGSNVEAVYKMIHNKVEALEFYVKEESQVTNVPLSHLRLKDNLLICAIIRNEERITPSGQDVILKGDSVIVVTTNIGLNDIQEIMKL
ncbi:MAG: Trk system potassium transporter TrkA [Lachnospiraceae bacterium]|nr:Trk system potassium transporter TrkA [Lachnospiraceae bacterium]